MIEFVQKSGKTDLVLFVHGFTGGRDTWRHEVDGFLYDHLLENAALREGYDIAVFEYYSTLVNLFPVADSIRQKIVSLFKSIQTKAKKNISIYEISNLLTARIRFDLENYQNIVVIAHSMGGLITKSYVLQELEAGRNCKVKVILSLAVPHLGADLATYGKLLSNNQQIEDLAPLSELCPKLNDAWVKCDDKPIIKYFYGAYDTVVTKQSAIGTDNLEQDIISCDDTHLTICKPPKNGLLVTAITKFLIDFKSHSTPFALQRVSDSEQYDDEIFVLKLLLADVHDASVRNSKEFFLNAEYARKLLSSNADQQKLQDLYDRIRTIYLNSYERHVAGDEVRNSSTLVSDVHARIIKEDAGFLKAAHPMLQALHKMGMLHQLANDLGNDIWWSEERSRNALKSAREKSSSRYKGEAH